MPKKIERKIDSESLRPQGVRLPQGARVSLDTFANELRRAFGSRSTSSEVARGLCMLALQLSHGAGGPKLARAFRLAASDPTDEGVQKALRELDEQDSSPEPERTERTPPTRPSASPTNPPPSH
jgi:hypothetical protein